LGDLDGILTRAATTPPLEGHFALPFAQNVK